MSAAEYAVAIFFWIPITLDSDENPYLPNFLFNYLRTMGPLIALDNSLRIAAILIPKLTVFIF